jgi:hypothetical protein
MSLRVKVIPEDPTHNGWILGPLVRRILSACGKPNAQVEVLRDPPVGGITDATDKIPIILRRFAPTHDLFLFLPDADGRDLRGKFQNLETEAGNAGISLICCAAEQEVEIWLLAGHRAKLKARWSELRRDASIKETVFPALPEAVRPPRAR